jgi:shikimate dehydrogenase
MRAKRFAVIGDPIAHSLSPVMQTAALRALGLPHTFEALRVPKELLPATLDRLRRGELHGLNVTVPHKVEALKLCDLFTDEVAVTGAVNTLFVDATGRLVGSNTDVEGLRADLLAEGIVPKRALLLGTGGAARAALVAISQLDCEVTVAGRDPESARRVTREAQRGNATSWSNLGGPYDLIVNATSAGMSGGEDGTPIAEAWDRAEKTSATAAYDLVYRPRETLFLARARAQGHRGIDGLGMLVEQGARALSIFIGTPIDPMVKRAMRDAVESATGGRPEAR